MGGRRDIEVARTYFEDHAGQDFTRPVKHAIGLRQERGDDGAIAAMGPSWETLDPEIEFDLAPIAGAGVVYRGFSGLLDYWDEWLGLWETYVYEIDDYVRMGDWVVGDVTMRAEGRAGISLDSRCAQACEIRGGKIVRMRVFPTMAVAQEELGRSRRGGIRDAFDRLAARIQPD